MHPLLEETQGRMANLLVDLEREIGLRGSFYDFVRMAWHIVEPGADFIENWHIELICLHLEALHRGDCKRLIINVPPGCMKSLLVSVFFPAWIWIREPGYRSLNSSFDAGLTRRDAGKLFDIMQSAWFQARWGNRFKLPNSVALSDFSNNHMGFRFSTSVQGKACGRHADCLAVDDPLKPKQWDSAKALDGVITWWGGTLATRFRNPTKGVKVIIMQRLHERDLVGHVLANNAHEDWVHLRLPMRYESAFPCVTPFGSDPRTIEGELLWPERFPDETVRALELDLGPMAAAAQLQQRPAPAGGAIFRADWFQTADELPTDFDEIVLSFDCTFKGSKTSDFVVGQAWGRAGVKYFLLDQVRGQWGFTATVKAIRDLSAAWPQARVVLVEEAANGSAACDAIEQGIEIEGDSTIITNLVRVKPEGGKVSRANGCTGIFEARNVFHPSPERAPWIVHHQAEMLSFPAGANDDTVDTTTQALNYMRSNQNWAEAAMASLFGR